MDKSFPENGDSWRNQALQREFILEKLKSILSYEFNESRTDLILKIMKHKISAKKLSDALFEISKENNLLDEVNKSVLEFDRILKND